jgi:pimeloyl-ACP methyl ester carboxylesterase
MPHTPVGLERPEGAMALLASEPEIAVIFVHGFWGDSRSTWIDFQNLVDDLDGQSPLWSQCDLFFYCYRSRDQIASLAEDFYSFIKNDYQRLHFQAVLPSSLRLSPRLPRSSVEYKHLVLVGHSAGAVIIREVVLQSAKHAVLEGAPSTRSAGIRLEMLMPRASLRLFAPAHLGAIVSGKVGFAMSIPVLDQISATILRSNPLYQNLRQSSATLTSLRQETEALFAEHPDITALKASLFFGQHEDVVEIGGYSQDEFYGTPQGQKHVEPNHNHLSICKPSATFIKPLEFVATAFPRTRVAP